MTFSGLAGFFRLFLIFTAIGLFFALHTYIEDQPGGVFAVHFYYEMTGAYAAMIWVPAIDWLTRVTPFSRRNALRALGINVAGAFAYTLLHSSAELLLRYPLQPLVGLHDSFVTMAQTTYLGEAPSDVVYYAFIVTALYLTHHLLASRELEAKLAEAKLENLRLQLQPHFLFNTLNAISTVMYEDVARADAMLSKLSDFLRVVLESGTVNEVALAEELAIERMYVDIMTTRLERQLSLNVCVDEDARSSAIPFMLLQPLIENSIRHGMGSSRASLALDIAVTRRDGQTVVTVDDDGLGLDPNARRGIGLRNVASRLEYMYGDRAAFEIAVRPTGGTRVVLRFPFAIGDESCR
ncbi:MAG TPA: histidine kinase [Candidatus Baltobacteraceae bacterium]|nr:histidine kinase [Candidatus Baltobacteraceae bacterium]